MGKCPLPSSLRCRQSLFPCGCETEGSSFLLAVSWRLTSLPRDYPPPLIVGLLTWPFTSSKPASEKVSRKTALFSLTGPRRGIVSLMPILLVRSNSQVAPKQGHEYRRCGSLGGGVTLQSAHYTPKISLG